MTMANMTAPETIQRLVEQFGRNLAAYRSGAYNETQVRVEFIDPFFIALGWDVHNTQGYAEAYKDVIHEDKIRLTGWVKAPDYCFRIGGTRKFFVEAKKPSVDIKHDVHPAYQLRRYAWSAKLPLSILTDFEEFAVYDCRIKPAQNDPASKGRILYFKFAEYLERWEEIEHIFSREAVLKGSFDKYAESTKRKRGTAEVDTAFLEEIESWREWLAHNIALRNSGISQRDLNHAVQTTIDRIVFLRIAEDRGLENYGQLQALLNGDQIYGRLAQLFHKADDRYNSGLFHFRREPGREHHDNWTLKLSLDDKVLKQIVKRLYYPESPYEFAVLPADILGQVYERFLGKVIRLKGRSAVVEEKPEVRKAGGVYYTPTYIVDYIVKHTVGKLVEGKTPDQVRGKGRGKAPIRVLDPACGSGSFLLGAYQFLLDWYIEQYKQQPEKHLKGKSPAIYESAALPAPGEEQPGREYRLTTAERKRILLDHIHGVDIDPQAVEVTKLSLLLKVLEGENIETLQKNMLLFHERALPDLAENIQCGNSLIGPDFYQGRQLDLDEDQEFRINIFDWQAGFPQVFKGEEPGFDAVIGNPPYIRIQTMKETAPETVPYYKDRYLTAIKGNYDIYVLFVERGLELLNTDGRLGFILPHKFFNAKYGQALRELISAGRHLEHVVHFSDEQVFKGATTYTCLMFLGKRPNGSVDYTLVDDLENWQAGGDVQRGEVPGEAFSTESWNISIGSGAALFDRLSKYPLKLGDIAHIFVGTQTSADDVFVLDECRLEGKLLTGQSQSLSKEVTVEAACTQRFLRGKDIRRYEKPDSRSRLICPYEITETASSLLPKQVLSTKFPLAYAYLEENKAKLLARERGRFGKENCYAFGYPKSMTLFQKPKIIVPDYNNVASYTIDEQRHFYKTGYGILVKGSEISPLYILGLLNSRLLFAYLLSIGTTLRGGYVRFWRQFLEQLPIYIPENPKDTEPIVTLTRRLLDLHQRLQTMKTSHTRTALQRQIEATSTEIDRLVYKHYGLKDSEIHIIEGTQQ